MFQLPPGNVSSLRLPTHRGPPGALLRLRAAGAGQGLRSDRHGTGGGHQKARVALGAGSGDHVAGIASLLLFALPPRGSGSICPLDLQEAPRHLQRALQTAPSAL